jgi:exodeoxyribonuclease VII large subunit
MTTSEKLSLSELQLIIRDSLYMALPDMYWVTAEISEINENSAGHCYLELIEKQPDEKNIRARIKAIIWCKKFRFLKSYFENASGEQLREGLKILVKTKVEYHEIYGLSLIICDIDPSYTLGDMALKRKLMIKRLEEEGVLTMNRDLGLPPLLQRIAIISSSGAAGYTDFMNHLNGNLNGYVFYTKLFESPMQGTDTEQGILTALDKIASHIELFDIVVIIRGGGSQVDLSWFDNYNIAYHITQFPIPVITGIGHDKDMSVTDIVACLALKTPTAVADFIVSHTSEAEDRLKDMWMRIRDLSRIIIESNRHNIESAGVRLLPLSRILISGMKARLSEKSIALVTKGKDYTNKAGLISANHKSRLFSGIRTFSAAKNLFIDQAKHDLITCTMRTVESGKSKLQIYDKTLSILSPENILQRGYTLTYLNGQIIKKREIINFGDIIDTRFSDGVITSRVIEIQEETSSSSNDD